MFDSGAMIERGIIRHASGSLYIVRSTSRDGMETPLIPALMKDVQYFAGQKVYFFMFDDGHGLILDTFD